MAEEMTGATGAATTETGATGAATTETGATGTERIPQQQKTQSRSRQNRATRNVLQSWYKVRLTEQWQRNERKMLICRKSLIG